MMRRSVKKTGWTQGVRAFTLVELLISVSILSVIAYLSAFTLTNFRKVSGIVDISGERRIEMFSFVSGLEREFSSAILILSNKRTRFVIKNDDDSSYIRFCYIDPVSVYETIKRDEVLEVEYRFKKESDNNSSLVKSIWYLSKNPDNWSEGEPDFKYVVEKNLDYFKVTAYRLGKQYKQWDSIKQRDIPDFIEIEFSIGGKVYREGFNVFISRM